MPPRTYTLQERFWRYVEPGEPDACWEWRGATDRYGYGRINRGGRNGQILKAHRASYELHTGAPIPPEMAVCHRCDNPPCVNPAHLMLGTLRDNSRDMASKGRAAAQRGHDNGRTKVSDDMVRAIRERAAAGEHYAAIADDLGLAHQWVSEVARGNRRLRAGGPIAAPVTVAERQRRRHA